MQRKTFAEAECPIALSLERVGEWWSMLIMRDALQGLRRFDEFSRSLEKVVINTLATESTDIIRNAVEVFGSQAIVGAVDVRRKLLGSYTVVVKSATETTRLNLQQHIENLVQAGVGELFINDVDRDGCMTGYDLALVRSVAQAPVPVVVCGGAGTLDHLREAVHDGGASAVAAGSMFVFHGKHRAVLINYPKALELEKIFQND